MLCCSAYASFRFTYRFAILSLALAGSLLQKPASAGGRDDCSLDPGGECQWASLGPFEGSVKTLAIDPSTPQTIYAGTFGGGVYKSLNGGLAWGAANKGLSDASVNVMAIDPSTPSTLYAGTQASGVYKSIDGGESWNAVSIGLPSTPIIALVINPENTSVLYAGTKAGGVYRSINGGRDWIATQISSTYTDITALALDPKSPEILYASTQGGGVWRYCGCSAPLKPTLTSPSGSISGAPTYSWSAVDGAEWYQLWVNDAAEAPKILQWYAAAEANCPSMTGACTVTPSTTLALGAGTWWVRAWNSCNGGSYSPWSDGTKFTVSSPGIPGKATLRSPSGTLATSSPEFFWYAVPTSTWYQLWVSDESGIAVIKAWYPAAEAGCKSGSGLCVARPAVVFAAGIYQWRIQTWNDAGVGPWSDGMAFTVSGSGVPGKATLVFPTGTLTTTTPTYIWNAVSSATWYYLWVNDSAGVPRIQAWYTAGQAGCATGSGHCSVMPGVGLTPGAGQWWVQTWNNAGYGPWSDPMQFTVTLSGITNLRQLIQR